MWQEDLCQISPPGYPSPSRLFVTFVTSKLRYVARWHVRDLGPGMKCKRLLSTRSDRST